MGANLAQINASNYRPAKGTLIVNGEVVTGIANGGVTFSFVDDLNSVTSGLDGSWLFVTKEACQGTCTVNLLQSSPFIAKFNQLIFANKFNDSGTFLLTYRSDSGNDIITMAAARFAKQPDLTFGDTATDRVYTIITGNMELTAG